MGGHSQRQDITLGLPPGFRVAFLHRWREVNSCWDERGDNCICKDIPLDSSHKKSPLAVCDARGDNLAHYLGEGNMDLFGNFYATFQPDTI